MTALEPIRTLIVTGQLSPEHDPNTNRLLRRMLESTGLFSVKITEEFRGATAETLSHYDLVILNYDGDFPYTGHPPVRLGASGGAGGGAGHGLRRPGRICGHARSHRRHDPRRRALSHEGRQR